MAKLKKTAKKIYYVIPFGNAWVVKNADKTKFTLITESKREAVSFATQLAKDSEADLIVYGKKGEITASKSFGVKARAVAKARATAKA
jgi:hypothetical protein